MHICSIYCQESIGFSEVYSVVTGANAGKLYSSKFLGLGWNDYEWGKPKIVFSSFESLKDLFFCKVLTYVLGILLHWYFFPLRHTIFENIFLNQNTF